MLNQEILEDLYIKQGLSAVQIAAKLDCSANKVNYWLAKHAIPKRTISDAIYKIHNPNGDPFTISKIDTVQKAELYGLGIGLYWGEGTKANKYSVRLGNTDPALVLMFIRFLVEIYGVKVSDMRFGLQIFTDIEPDEALRYWIDKLGVTREQFYKIHITKSGSIGNYRKKSQYGVLTVYYHNKRLRDIIVGALPR